LNIDLNFSAISIASKDAELVRSVPSQRVQDTPGGQRREAQILSTFDWQTREMFSTSVAGIMSNDGGNRMMLLPKGNNFACLLMSHRPVRFALLAA